MSNAPSSDVTDFLLSKASSQPDLIIDLYTGQDTQLRLLLIEAQNKGIIRIENGMFLYGDVMLGVTEQAVILFFKDIANKEILSSIKKETFPNMVRMTESSTPPKGKGGRGSNKNEE